MGAVKCGKTSFSTNIQWQTHSPTALFIVDCVSNSHEGLLTSPFLIFSVTKQTPGVGVGGPGQPLCQAWEYENGGDRMLMRRPEALPPTTVPWSAPLCQPVMNLWGSTHLSPSHSLPTAFSPQRETETGKHTECSVFSINHQMSCCRKTTTHFVCYLSQSNWLCEAHEFKITVG